MSAYNDLPVQEFVAEFKRAVTCFDELNKQLSKEGKYMAKYVVYDNDKMLKMAKKAVMNWYNSHNGPASIDVIDVYIVWFCKTLQNWKALCGTNHSDGMYYEVTYDGDKGSVYLDAYKKWDNQKYTGGELL